MNPLELDPRSIAATVMLSGLLLALVVGVMQTTGSHKSPSILLWFWACVCATLSLGQSAWLPPGEYLFLSHTLSNFLLHLAVVLVWLGARQHAGKSAPMWTAWAAALFAGAWGWQFGVATPNHTVRVAVLSAVLCGWCTAGAWAFFRLREDNTRLARWMTSLPLIVFAVLMLLRAASALMFGASNAANMRTPMNVATHLVGSLVLMSTMVGIIILLNARLSGEIRRLAFEDMLTGASSRRGLYEMLLRWLDRQTSAGTAHVALIDLDHFKSVNDQLGHATGDTVLKRFVMLCQQQSVADSVVARLGGDEFAVLLPASLPREHIEAWSAELQAAFETDMRSMLAVSGLQQLPGLSIGYAAITKATTEAFDQALREADALLYREKAGRRPLMRYLRSGPAPLT